MGGLIIISTPHSSLSVIIFHHLLIKNLSLSLKIQRHENHQLFEENILSQEPVADTILSAPYLNRVAFYLRNVQNAAMLPFRKITFPPTRRRLSTP